MSHPARPGPGPSDQTGESGMASQEILTATTATDETPPIGTLRQSCCSGIHPPSPQGHAPTSDSDSADRGAAHLFLSARSIA